MKIKIISFFILLVLILVNISPVFAFSFENNQIINLKKDHQCASLLKVKGKDYIKTVIFVVYEDPETGIKQPAFCVEPSKDGIGTGAGDSYDVTLKLLNDKCLWRVLYKGYMGSSYSSWNLECDDDLFYATKTAVNCLMEGSVPNIKYEIPHRVGIGENLSLEEVQRRAKKVLEVTQQLYDYGLNGDEDYSKPIVSVNKSEEIKEETINGNKYLVQNYNVTGNRGIDSYKVNISDFPKGTKILNEYNTESNNMYSKNFKIVIPIKEVKNNIKGKIHITEAKVKTYPVFYAQSYSEDTQSYITYADPAENASTSVSLDINAYKSSIKIIKVDNDTKIPLQGVKFSAIYLDNGQTIGEFTTDSKGIINITGLRQGKIRLIEKSTLEDYELDPQNLDVELEYNQSKEIEIYNKHKKGNIEILKVDKEDNNLRLAEVEFDLIDSSGNIAAHVVTDSNGEAKLTGINTGDYILKETKTKDEYKIAIDQEIKINWNKTLSLKVENIKKKGQIKIIKVDKENNNIRLKNVEFKVFDNNNNEIETLITDDNGEAITSNLPIGTYYIKEIKTDEKHLLNDTKTEIQVYDDKTSEITIQNERIKGKIKITKTSEDKNKILNLDPGSPIQGVKFNIYDVNNIFIEQIITDKDGIAISKSLDKGKYIVKEIETGKWYILNDQKYNIEITENNQIQELEIKNKSEDPNVDVTKSGKNTVESNEEIDYQFQIKNTGNTDLSKFTWYDILPSEFAKITKIETGTYNQDINYGIYYKTNKKNGYMVIKKELNSKENNYIDLSNIHLENDEKVIEIKIYFGDVKVGFENIEKPHIFMKINDGLENNTKIQNYTILEGYDKEYKVCDEDTTTSTVYNIVKQKKLPRTGF